MARHYTPGAQPVHRAATQTRPLYRRILDEMETVGVAPVPDSQRRMTSGKMFIVWAMASASATTPLIASLLYNFGLRSLIVVIVLSWLIGFIPAGLFSEMGREIPLTALVVARRTYGTIGSFLLSILFTLVNAGWFGLNTAIGGQILNALAPLGETAWMWIVGAVQVVLVLFGMKWLEYFYRYTSALFVVCYGALALYLFTHYHLTAPAAHGALHWGAALTTVLSFSILAWTYKASTVSRFAAPYQRGASARNTLFFLAPSVGIMLAVLLMSIVGIYAMQGIKSWNVALLGPHIPVWGFVAAIGVALAIVHTNAMNLYPSTVDLLVALNAFRQPRAWEQPLATIALGVLATLLAVGGILSHVQNFLGSIGDVVFPFTFIMLADWLWIQCKRTPVDEFFARPSTALAWLFWPGAVAFAIGVALSAWGDRIAPSVVTANLPLPVVASLIAAAVYLVLALPLRRALSAASSQP